MHALTTAPTYAHHGALSPTHAHHGAPFPHRWCLCFSPGALTTTPAPVAEAAPQHAPAHHGAYALLPHRYARTRREAAMADACSLACHIAFAYSAIAASQADDARTAAMLAGASKSAAAAAVYDARDELPLFALLSSR